MGTANSNRIARSLNEQEIATLDTAIKTLETTFSWLTGLSTEDRKSIPKINNSNKTFAEDALNGLGNNPAIFPAYLSTADLQQDLQLFTQIEPYYQRYLSFTEKLGDTQMLAGSEAYISALSVYRLSEAAAVAGVPGSDTLFNLLKKRFENQGNQGSSVAIPPTE